MATRLYFPSTGAAPVTPAAWQFTALVVSPSTLAGTTTPSGTAPATLTGATSTTSPIHRGMQRYVYGPLAAQSISGTVKAQMRCAESSTGANATLAMAIKLVQPDGSNRSTLLAQTASDSTATPPEMVTTLTNRRLLNTAETTPHTLTTQSATAGDYLVVEIGFRSATTTSRTISLRRGDNNGSDLPETDAGTTDLNPWIEFSATLAFYVPPSEGFGAAALTLGAAGVGQSLRSGSGAAALTLGAAGEGEAPALPIPEGSGEAGLSLSAAGTGQAIHVGDGSAGLTLGAAGTGQALHSGSGAAGLALGAAGEGQAIQSGAGAAPLSLAASGEGQALHSGDGATALGLGAVGAGQAIHSGSGGAALTLGAAGEGEAPAGAIPEGFGEAALSLGAAGEGASTREGFGVAALTLAASGVGQAIHYGDGAAALSLAAAGEGEAPVGIPQGFGEAALVLAAAGVGASTREGFGAAMLQLGAAGYGSSPGVVGPPFAPRKLGRSPGSRRLPGYRPQRGG